MRFRGVSITGFTGVSDAVEIDLDADVVVVMAANGYGKSTICDAIAWALTGEHPRGADPRSLYTRSGETHVALTLVDAEGQEVVVRRLLDNPSEERLTKLVTTLVVDAGGRRVRGPEATARLSEIMLSSYSSTDKSGMSRVLTDGYYLQQESLREFLVGRSDDERFAGLARMVGAGDLNALVAAFNSAKTSWSRALNEMEREVDTLLAQVDASVLARDALVEEARTFTSTGSEAKLRAWMASAAELLGDDGSSVAAVDHENAIGAAGDRLRALSARLASQAEHISAALAEARVEVTVPHLDVHPVPPGALEAAALRLRQAKEAAGAADSAVAQAEGALQVARTSRQELANLAELALRHLAEECPTCGQAVDPTKLRTRLERMTGTEQAGGESAMLSAALDQRAAAQAAVLSAAAEFESLQQQSEQVARLAAVTAAATERQREREHRLARALAVVLPGASASSNLVETAERVLASIQGRRARVSELLDEVERLRVQARVGSNARRLAVAEEQLAERMEHYDRVKREFTARSRTAAVADALARALKEDAENFVNDRLQELQPILDQLYAAIDPHPTFRDVSLVTRNRHGKNRLVPIVRDDAGEVQMDDPGRTLSTSQANALAVTIFLAFNLGLVPTRLQAVVLDDPLQNLDDVHLLGLVDLLRRIGLYRQLIVTTHDSAFAALLARKLRPVQPKQRVRVLRIVKWDRSGPQLETDLIEPDLSPIKLAL